MKLNWTGILGVAVVGTVVGRSSMVAKGGGAADDWNS